jgi:putative ABC transport system permease protein
METLLKDIRYSLRTLYRSPAFTTAALVILALGIGAIGAIFTVVDGVVLKPLPYNDPNRLVRIYGAWDQGSREGISPPDFFDYRDQSQSLEAVAAESSFSPLLNLSGREKPVQLSARFVSAGFFKMLGVMPQIGREFKTDEEVWQGPHLVMLGHAIWVSSFGSDSAILGKQITMNDLPYTVVGVLPPFFDMAGPADIYLPQQQKLEVMRKIRSQVVIGRLKPGGDVNQVQNEMNVVSQRLAQTHSDVDKNWHTVVLPLHEEVVRNFRLAMFMLLIAVALVVLIVVTNLANLMLAKVAGQQNEIALRVALGASRFRVARQLFTFSTIVALLGGGLGAGLTYFVINLIKRLGPASIPRLTTITVDFTAILFMLVVSIVIGVVLGLVPMTWVGKMALSDNMKQGSRVLGSRLGKMQTGLIVAEIALTMVLVVGAGLLIRSLSLLQKVDPGFKSSHLLVTRITLPFNKYNTNEKLAAFWRELIPKLESLPGVEAAAASSELPLSGLNNPTAFKAVTPDQREYATYVRSITPNYIHAMGVPLLAGRELSPTDKDGTPVVILINDVFKHDVFGAENPIGKELQFPVNSFGKATVVGVVGNTHHTSLAAEPAREVYMAVEQGAILTYSLAIRTRQDPVALVRPVQQAVWSMDQSEAMASFVTMDDMIQSGLTQERFRTLVLVLFSIVAIVLSGIGLYGVLSYLVSQRSQEIGIRMALGAKQQDILRLILARGIRLSVVGMLVGAALAVILTRVLKSLLFGVSAFDPVTLIAVPVLLILIGSLASYAPAWRASRINPVYALRNE